VVSRIYIEEMSKIFMKGDYKKGQVVGLIFLVVMLVVVLNMSFVFAEDVAYIYRNINAVDDNVVDVFEDAGLSVDLIQENDIPNDIRDYRILFVGDERFRNVENIPVGEISTIISNYYFGEDWGLTDGDGISKLGSNSELSVRMEDTNEIIQVYTQAKYPGRSIAIPYYYLDEHNRINGLEKIAGTYTGNDYNFGDVISYANAGTHLINGNVIDGRLCFFGIVESDFWTNDAREMFEDCVDFVGLICERDSDCLGGGVEELYCKNGDVYQDEFDFECKNPGTINSRCEENSEEVLVEVCEFGCSDGECVNECILDSDCGEDYYEDEYCEGSNVVRDFYQMGCSNEECGGEVVQEIVEVCDEGCNNAECVSITCNSDDDCGFGRFIGDKYCYEGDSWQKFRGYECFLPGSVLSYCDYSDGPTLVDVCESYCSRGECKTCEELHGVNRTAKPKDIRDYLN